jgi:hypothetical protein
MVRELIGREFGVRLSEASVGRLLRRLGLSPQRPLYRAYQQNRRRWLECRDLPAATGGGRPGQGSLVADAEPGDGHVVRRAVAGQHPKREILLAASLDLLGGAHADRVGVQQHAQQCLGVVGGMAVAVGPVAAQERFQVELVDDVEDEPGEVVGWQPVAKVGGSRNGWSRSPCRKL